MARAYNLHHRRNQLNELRRAATNKKRATSPRIDELMRVLREHLGPLSDEVYRELAAVVARALSGSGNAATITRKRPARE